MASNAIVHTINTIENLWMREREREREKKRVSYMPWHRKEVNKNLGHFATLKFRKLLAHAFHSTKHYKYGDSISLIKRLF